MAITDKDITKLKTVFATKEDLKNFATKEDLAQFKNEMRGEMKQLREESKQHKDDVLNKLDGVMDELVKAREDRTLAVGKDREQDRRLDGVESRLTKVEVPVG
ncbi:hypothetical protein HZB07_05380 [Candidatus Saganbacteria bacterium]|nr:hypothetical protein [Candidatus Saganbacteria bacterium]